jgi:hypothetical protein
MMKCTGSLSVTICACVLVVLGGCGAAARGTARSIGYAWIDHGVDKVMPHIDTAKTAAKRRLHTMTRQVSNDLAAKARSGFSGAITKLEVRIDEVASQLSSAAMREVDTVLDAATEQSAKLWTDSIDATFMRLRTEVHNAAGFQRQAIVAQLEAADRVDRELELSKARANAWTAERVTLIGKLQVANEARTECILKTAKLAAPELDSAGAEQCETQFQAAIATAHAAAQRAVDVAVDQVADALDRQHAASDLLSEAAVRAKQWERDQLAALNANATGLRMQARAQADQMMAAVRTEMAAASERLRAQLHDRLKFPGADCMALGDDTQLAEMVDGALDGFMENLGEHIKTTLRVKAREGVDALVNGIRL